MFFSEGFGGFDGIPNTLIIHFPRV